MNHVRAKDLRAEESSNRKARLYERFVRTQESSMRKSLPYERVLRTEEPSAQHVVLQRIVFGEIVSSEKPYVGRNLSYGSLSHVMSLRTEGLPYGRGCTGKSSVQRRVPYGRVFRTEESCTWTSFRMRRCSFRKSFAYARVFRKVESSIWKSHPFGELSRTEEPSVWRSLDCGRVFRTEMCSVRKSFAHGRLFCTEEVSTCG